MVATGPATAGLIVITPLALAPVTMVPGAMPGPLTGMPAPMPDPGPNVSVEPDVVSATGLAANGGMTNPRVSASRSRSR